MPATKLTKRNVDGHVKRALAELRLTQTKEVIVWDEELAGLGLRIGQSGKASWLIYKRLGNGGRGAKQIVSVFGTLGEIPDPEDARSKARPILEDIRNGIDPNARKRQARFAEHVQFRDGKVGDLWDTWLSRSRARGKSKRLKGTDYWHGVERLGKVEILPVLGRDTLIHTITKAQVRKLIEAKEEKSPSVARMMFAALRPFFLWCVEREAITVSPMAELSQPEKVKSRDRVLSDSEIVTVWSAASAMAYPWGPFYRLCLLTAQRRDEIATMEWGELHHQRREWKIPASKTKNGNEHLVHLSPMAWEIIDGLAKKAPRIGEGRFASRYVFTTTNEVAISGFSKARLSLDTKIEELSDGASMPRWTVHDLRRTAATGMAALKVPPHIVERILNHISGKDVGGLVGVYQHFEYVEERRKALIDWANHINGLLQAEKDRERKGSNILRFGAN